MSVGEFTVSNIHMDEDKREEEKKKGIVDMVKLLADIAAQSNIAKQVDAQPRIPESRGQPGGTVGEFGMDRGGACTAPCTCSSEKQERDG